MKDDLGTKSTDLVPPFGSPLSLIHQKEQHAPKRNHNTAQLSGLDPDVKVDFTKDDADKGRDPQLDKAIEILRLGKFPVSVATTTATKDERP